LGFPSGYSTPMQGTWEVSGLHCAPKNQAAPLALVASGVACALLSLLGESLGCIHSPSSCPQKHLSAVAAWRPWCGSGGAQVGEVHHMRAVFFHRFGSPRCCILSWTWFCQDMQAGVQSEVHREDSAAKLLNCLPCDGEITPAPPGPWFIISPVCSLINDSYVNRHFYNPLLPITLATAQQSRPSSLDVLRASTCSAALPVTFWLFPLLPHLILPQGLNDQVFGLLLTSTGCWTSPSPAAAEARSREAAV